MAKIDVENTAEGREIVYHVCLYPGMFGMLDSTGKLIDHLGDEFKEHLWEVVPDIEDEFKPDECK